MARFILRFRGSGGKPAADVERIRLLPTVAVIDDSLSRMMLVEGPEAQLRAAVELMPGWVMSKEEMIPLPDPRPKLRGRR